MDPSDLEKSYAAAMAGSDEPDYMEITLGFLRRTCASGQYAALNQIVAKFVEDHKDLPDDTWIGLTKNSVKLLDT
jgi:hypothetical protein